MRKVKKVKAKKEVKIQAFSNPLKKREREKLSLILLPYIGWSITLPLLIRTDGTCIIVLIFIFCLLGVKETAVSILLSIPVGIPCV